MHEVKDTGRALVRIGFDGRVHKTFRGEGARERFDNEVRVLRHLEARGCTFVPRLLAVEPQELKIITTNCGSRLEHLDDDRMRELFAELAPFGVQHDDRMMRNVTYRISDGRFCLIDFEFATLVPEGPARPAALAWSGQTHRGRFRAANEDNFLALAVGEGQVHHLGSSGQLPLTSDFVFAVTDGLGGARSGEFASRIAVEKITQFMPGIHPGRGDGPEDAARILAELFAAIHGELIKLGRSYAECAGMGSTLSLGWFTAGRMQFGHVGDSRIYALRSGGGLRQLTEDQNHVGWLRRNGRINEREAREHPRRHALEQALGAGHQFIAPQLGSVPCEPGDRFLICSDGLVEGLWDERIGEILAAPGAGAATARQLVGEAVESSGRDNVTAVFIAALP